MHRIMRMMMAVVLPIGMLLFGAANAQAQTVDCTSHVLDATVRQDVDTDFINKQIDALYKVVPGAEVFVQAYEQLPDGNTADFWKLCANWRNAAGDNPKDNLVLVVYGRDVDQVSVYYGYAFETAISPYRNGMMNMANVNLGPDRSQVNGDYLTSALVEPLISTPFYLKTSAHYSAADGTYHLPPYDPGAGFQSDVASLVKVTIIVIVALTLLGIVLRPFERAVNRRIDQHREQNRY